MWPFACPSQQQQTLRETSATMQQLAVLRSRGCCALARPLPLQNPAHRLRAAASKGFGAPEEPQTTAQEVKALWIGT